MFRLVMHKLSAMRAAVRETTPQSPEVFVWLNRITLAVAIASILAYVFTEPLYLPSGDSFIGLTLGIIAGILVLKLMFLGIKKRWLIGLLGSQKLWVVAHHYTGCVLLVISLLHAGFQIDANIHGALIVLLMFIVLTGLMGSLGYRLIPPLLNRQNEHVSEETLLVALKDLDKELLSETAAIDVLLNQMAWDAYRKHSYQKELSPFSSCYRKLVPGLGRVESFSDFVKLAETRVESKPNGEEERLHHLLLNRKSLVARLNKQNMLQALLSKWRPLHLLASIGFFALLIVHVVISFMY